MTDAVLEAELRDIGRHVAWPPTPDLAPTVRLEVERGPEVAKLPRRPVRRAVVLAAAALLVVLGGALALSPGLRAAILRFFTLPGVTIEVDETAPPEVTPPAVDAEPFLGRRVALDEARREVSFPVAVPEALGEPDEVYLLGGGERALVTLAYHDALGVPVDPETGYAVLLTQLEGRPNENLIKKTDLEARVVPVNVNGEQGYFVQGEHLVFVQAPGADPIADEPRIAGNTLLWTRGSVTLRLEANVPLDRALDIARTAP
ncbi:MAG: hypothetical protein ACRDHB_03400 [Actinomycetota bacterium]